jgi:hypothetical protein
MSADGSTVRLVANDEQEEAGDDNGDGDEQADEDP